MTVEAYTDAVSRKPKPTPTPLAAWVRAARGKVPQAEFADRVGVHFVTVSRWESQGMGLTAKHIEAIRKAFPGTPPPPVDGMSDPDRTVPPDTKERRYEVQSTEGTVLARMLDKLPEAERPEALRRCLNALAGVETQAHPSELAGDKRRHPGQHK